MIELSQGFKRVFLALMAMLVFSVAGKALADSKADPLSQATFYVH